MPSVRDDRPLLLVTGSSGLIGSRLLKAFAPDFRVAGLDLRPPPKADGSADFIACDLTRDAEVDRALGEVSRRHGDRIASVIHLAAYYDFSGEASPLYRKLTVEGTRRLLRGLRELEVEQFIYASSLLVMAPAQPGEAITEASPLAERPWAYPRSKIEAERVVLAEHGEIPAVILRIAGVYSEAGDSMPIAQHIARIYEKRLESVLFPGDLARGAPYVHLKDLDACLRSAVERRKALGRQEVLLIAEPEPISHLELQRALGVLIHGRTWPAIRIPKAAARAGAWAREALSGERGFIRPWMVALADSHYPVDIRRAREVLGWKPDRRLRDALPEMVRRLKADPEAFYKHNGLPPRRGFLDACPPGMGYNPSSWRERIPVCVLGGAAFLISAYLALYQWRLVGDAWDPVFGAQTRQVLDSETSAFMRRWMKIPDAALGAIAYLGDVLFGLAGSTRRWQYRPWLVVLFGIDVIPLGLVSAVLVAMQGTVVGAWCFLCLVTAAISLVLVWLTYDEVWATLCYLMRVWKRTRDWRAVWKTFWGQRVAEAEEVALEGRTDVAQDG